MLQRARSVPTWEALLALGRPRIRLVCIQYTPVHVVDYGLTGCTYSVHPRVMVFAGKWSKYTAKHSVAEHDALEFDGVLSFMPVVNFPLTKLGAADGLCRGEC